MVELLALGTVVIATASVLRKATPSRRTARSLCFARPVDAPRPRIVHRTFLFADLSGFTALAEAEGDVAAARVAARFQWAARRSLRGDTVLVKTLGDGVMFAADEPAAAVATALALRQVVEAEPELPGVSAGLHRGEAVEVDGDYYGSAVNRAARLAAEASGGHLLCTEEVARDVAGEVRTLPLGLARLKGTRDPVVLYELVEHERVGGPR